MGEGRRGKGSHRRGREEEVPTTPPGGGTFLGCRKVGFWFPLARKKPEICFSTPEAGLFGQKSIKRAQKHATLGVFGNFPKISKCPRANNYMIDTTFSFEGRSGVTMFFEHVNFQPRPGLQSPKKLFSSKRPLLTVVACHSSDLREF
jgi:hypothetical protein